MNHETREAIQGNKTIKLTLAFHTTKIAEEEGHIVPKHAWSNGAIKLRTNSLHGISKTKSVPFNSLMELPAVLEQLLIDEGITLHPSHRTKRYMHINIED